MASFGEKSIEEISETEAITRDAVDSISKIRASAAEQASVHEHRADSFEKLAAAHRKSAELWREIAASAGRKRMAMSPNENAPSEW